MFFFCDFRRAANGLYREGFENHVFGACRKPISRLMCRIKAIQELFLRSKINFKGLMRSFKAHMCAVFNMDIMRCDTLQGDLFFGLCCKLIEHLDRITVIAQRAFELLLLEVTNISKSHSIGR